MNHNYNFTDYPNIYKDTYWGGFVDERNDEICEYRNMFVKLYKITKHVSKVPDYIYKETARHISHFLDHIECYMNACNMYICIASPHTCNEADEWFLERDWIKTSYKMYSQNTTTYVKCIPVRIPVYTRKSNFKTSY